MATPRDIRRLAFQALFQLDARSGSAHDAAAVRESLDQSEGFTPKDLDEAFRLAVDAYAGRRDADKQMAELAPTWPAHRQAAVDRAILRLAHFEMTSGRTPPKAAINEAVELAKAFSTEKSPSFINGLLDKVLKKIVVAKAELAPPAALPDGVDGGSGGASESGPERPTGGPGEGV
jgi:N utilization substance protein B